MRQLFEKPIGGDRRSIGRSDEIVADFLNQPNLFKILIVYLQEKSNIVKTWGMRAFADIADADEKWRPALMTEIRTLTGTGTPARQARGRKLIAHFVSCQYKSAP